MAIAMQLLLYTVAVAMTQINNMRNMEETDTLICWTEHKISDERAHAYRVSFCEVFSILI